MSNNKPCYRRSAFSKTPSQPANCVLRSSELPLVLLFTYPRLIIAFTNVPNWIRMFVRSLFIFLVMLMTPRPLLLLSVLSFVPQFKQIMSKKTSSDISTCYVLFNLISTTEQFSLAFHMAVYVPEEPSGDELVHLPVNAGEWISLAQMTVIAFLWLIL